MVTVVEGECLLPWKFGGEPSREATSIPTALPGQSPGSLLLHQRQRKETIGMPVCCVDEIRVDTMVHDLEEPVLGTGLGDHLGGGGDVPAPSEVDGGDVEELLGGVRGGLLVVRPDELHGDFVVVAEDGGVEDEVALDSCGGYGHCRRLWCVCGLEVAEGL